MTDDTGCQASHIDTSDGRCPLPPRVDELWEQRRELSDRDPSITSLVFEAVDLLDAGEARVAWVDAQTDDVLICERARRAIGLSFVVLPMQVQQSPDPTLSRPAADQVPIHRRASGPGCARSLGKLHRPRRRAPPVVCQHRRASRSEHHG